MRHITALVVFLVAAPAIAEGPSPVGRWKTWDDSSKKAEAIVVIREDGGVLSGQIEALLDPEPGNPDPVCDKCEGELRNKRIIGMQILSGLRKDGNAWSGGRILDPDDGKTYRCKLTLAEGGNALEVRGFLGVSLFGRSQRWTREP